MRLERERERKREGRGGRKRERNLPMDQWLVALQCSVHHILILILISHH